MKQKILNVLNSVLKFFKPKRRLYGINLEKWMYVGKAEVSFANYEGKTVAVGTFLYFIDRKNFKKRQFKFISSNKAQFQYHNWYIQSKLWASGDGIPYALAVSDPSDELRHVLYVQHAVVFDPNTKKFVHESQIQNGIMNQGQTGKKPNPEMEKYLAAFAEQKAKKAAEKPKPTFSVIEGDKLNETNEKD